MSYPWQSLSPKDSFFIQQQCFITDIDKKIVTFLYQPIIGSHAYSLYMTLLSEIDEHTYHSREHLHSEIFSLLSMGIPEFYQARIRLEGIGLLKTFVKEDLDKKYIYEPCCPVSSKHFFEDDLLRLLLLDRVGERKLAELQKRFSIQKKNREKVEEITKSFLNVYDFSETSYQQQEKFSQSSSQDNQKLVGSQEGKAPSLKETSFNFPFLEQLLEKEYFSKDALTKDLKNTIHVLHTLYGIDEIGISPFVLRATNLETGKVDTKELESEVASSYGKTRVTNRKIQDKVEKQMEQTKVESSDRKSQLERAGYSQQEIHLIQVSERMTPIQFITDIKDQKKGSVTSNERKLLNVLLAENDITPAVLNILIYYMLVVQNAPTMIKGKAEAIVNDWTQAYVKLPEQAIEKTKQFVGEKIASAERRQENRSTAKYYGKNVVRKIEKLPEWAKDNQAEVTEELLPDDVQEKMNQRLKKFREAGKAGDK